MTPRWWMTVFYWKFMGILERGLCPISHMFSLPWLTYVPLGINGFSLPPPTLYPHMPCTQRFISSPLWRQFQQLPSDCILLSKTKASQWSQQQPPFLLQGHCSGTWVHSNIFEWINHCTRCYLGPNWSEPIFHFIHVFNKYLLMFVPGAGDTTVSEINLLRLRFLGWNWEEGGCNRILCESKLLSLEPSSVAEDPAVSQSTVL